MNSFDSIKFEIPDKSVQKWDCEYFDTIERTNNLTGLIETHQQTGIKSKTLPIGIGQLIYSDNKFIVCLLHQIWKS